MEAELNSVQQFYAGKTVFITGVSGFMGKVLLEKLLNCCSDVKEIIILMRDKRGVSAPERVEGFKNLELFKILKTEKPEVFGKIYPVFGDITQPKFGLHTEALKRVVDTTQIVFHMAASLKMEAPLRPNILINLVGTKNMLTVAKSMKKLVQIVHLSTAFCNVEPEKCFEQVYDFEHDPDDLIRMSEWMSDAAMESMQKELLGPHPNTYTYTKRLAEILVRREYGKLPICIARPTVVLPTYRDPFPGWVDSLNGVVGIFYAAAKGVLRSMLADPESRCEYIPVDTAINALILIAKNLATTERASEIPVYHITCDDAQKLHMGKIFQMVRSVGEQYPVSWALWYPDGNMTMNPYKNALYIFLFQMIPAYVIDFFLVLFRQKPFLVHVQKRIADGAEVLQFFTMRSWYFKQENFQNLMNDLSPSEYHMFLIDCINFTHEYKYIENAILGGRQYCAKDPLSTLPTARLVNKIQYVLHIFCKCLFYIFVIKYALKAFGVYDLVSEFFVTKTNDFYITK